MLLTFFNNRDSTVQITVCDADGDLVPLSANDYMRVKIGRGSNAPVIDLKAGVASANGSVFPNTNPFVLTLDRDDMATLNSGIWDLEVSFYDDSSSHFYFAEIFELEVRPTMAGDIT